jgi:hypothetical protein
VGALRSNQLQVMNSPKCKASQVLTFKTKQTGAFFTFLQHQLGSTDHSLSTHSTTIIKTKKRKAQSMFDDFQEGQGYKAETISMIFKQKNWVVKNLQSEPSAWSQ